MTGGRNPTFQVKDGEVGQQDAGHQSANFLDIGPGFPTIQVGKPGYRLCTRTTDKLKGVTCADVCPGSSSGVLLFSHLVLLFWYCDEASFMKVFYNFLDFCIYTFGL